MKTAEEILKSKLDGKITFVNNPDYTFNKVIEAMEEYRLQSHPSPMSAEQVEVLHAIMVLAEHGIPGYAFGDNEAACEMDNRLSEICRLASTAPSVKAEGWVNIYEDIQGRYIGDSEYSSYQEALDERDELSTYLETVQISRLPAPPKQQL